MKASLTPEAQAVATVEADHWMGLAVSAAARAGYEREDLPQLAQLAWDHLAAVQANAASEAGRSATTRRGPVRKKGRRS